ncbi:hypothetical protein O181_033616 [Austropuccinia psidii MF-1]|uniref:Uncharacterized protein n=1 Tax=Austropuccinia psidii MF-1 TaxID=1389203 RepID=A0A9Q3H792_9BASI|nr:hypothetical protein [Austropuccinia psidii MF-1]
MKIAFLPDTSQSIHGIQHPNKQMNEKRFSKKYWEKATQKYNLSHEIHGDDSDESESDSEDNERSSRSGIGSLSNDKSNSDREKESSDLDENEIMEEDSQMETSQKFPAQIIGESSGMGYGYNWENWK